MNVQPGTYKITNLKGGTSLTLAAYDDRTVVGFPEQLEVNTTDKSISKSQQWIIDYLGDVYSIRSARTQGYLSFGCPSVDGPPIIAVPHPATWVFGHEPFQAENVFRIHWPNGNYAIDLESGSSKPSTKVQLWINSMDILSERWSLKRLPDSDLSVVTTSSVRTTKTTTTTTTTTTAVTIPIKLEN